MTYRGTFSGASPPRALAFLKRHVEMYLESEIERTLKVVRAEVDFLKGQLEQNENELSRTEAALRDFKMKNLEGLPEQARDQFASRLSLKTRQSMLASELERATLELGAARQKVAQDDPSLERKVQSSRPYQDAIVETRRKLGERRSAGLGEEHPEVVRLRKQIEELERLSQGALAAEGSELESKVNPLHKALRDRVTELEVRRTAAEKELQRVSGELGLVDKVVRELPEVEARYSELTRSYAATKDLHGRLFERFKASELQLELERASAAARYEIVTAPQLEMRSLRKTVLLRVLVGGVVGLIAAIGIGLVIEARRYVVEQGY
jgi:uncharacterized protein involved in exopolysaccharide biosynthesis